jgi:choline dehydrogenase-like flavoprotein
MVEHPVDREIAMEALQHGLYIANRTVALDGATPLSRTAWILRDRRRLEKTLPTICDSGYHPCGTVPMAHPPATSGDERGATRG